MTGDMTFAQIVRARTDDDRIGLLFEDQSIRWSDVVSHSAVCSSIAADFIAWDAPPHIGVLLDNVPEFLYWLCGAALAGATVVGINPTRRGTELARDIAHTDCQLFVTDTAGATVLSELLGRNESGVSFANDRILVVGSEKYRSLLDRYTSSDLSVHPGVSPETNLLLLFTSGTTGDPKAVRCTQGRLARIAQTVSTQYEFRREDVTYQTMPMFHGNALMANIAPAMHVGSSIALRRKFSASGFLPDIRKFGATYFNYVGKALTYILATPELPSDAQNSLARCFGNEASHRDIAEFERRFGCRIVEGYGSSEGGAVINLTPDTPPGSLGSGREGVAILDPTTGLEKERARFDDDGRLLNAEAATGEIANLLGAPGFEGYYNNVEADQERIRKGIYWSGDLGYRDEAGWFYFAGRGADWIRVDGENFAVAPVERLLYRMPGVITAAVFAVPDPRSGDAVMAVLETESPAAFDPGEFAAFLLAQRDLGDKWPPRFVRVTSHMPLTGSMKVMKQQMRVDSWAPAPTTSSPDPVYVRSERGPLTYELLTAKLQHALIDQYVAHGREGLLPPDIAFGSISHREGGQTETPASRTAD